MTYTATSSGQKHTTGYSFDELTSLMGGTGFDIPASAFDGGAMFAGIGMFQEFGFQFDFSMNHQITTDQQSQEWFNIGILKATKMWGYTKETGEGFFTKFSTIDNGHLASSGVGIHTEDFSASLNYDIDNFGLFLDIGIGPWDIMPEISLKNGISFGHTNTDEATGEMQGAMVSFPILPTPGPLGGPSPVPVPIP